MRIHFSHFFQKWDEGELKVAKSKTVFLGSRVFAEMLGRNFLKIV